MGLWGISDPLVSRNLIFTCTRHILTGKHVIEVVHRSRFSDTCRWTHGSTQSQCFSMGKKSPQNCPSPWVDPDPRLIHGYLGPSHPTRQTSSRSLQPFSQGTSSWHSRPTDRQTTEKSLAIRPIVYAVHIRCGIIVGKITATTNNWKPKASPKSMQNWRDSYIDEIMHFWGFHTNTTWGKTANFRTQNFDYAVHFSAKFILLIFYKLLPNQNCQSTNQDITFLQECR